MINEKVIREIYRKFSKPHNDRSELRLEHYIKMLKHHAIILDNDEIIMSNLDEFNPFRRFLIRSINAVLEFDKMVALVFRSHIIFLSKDSDQMRIHMKPERRPNLLGRILGQM